MSAEIKKFPKEAITTHCILNGHGWKLMNRAEKITYLRSFADGQRISAVAGYEIGDKLPDMTLYYATEKFLALHEKGAADAADYIDDYYAKGSLDKAPIDYIFTYGGLPYSLGEDCDDGELWIRNLLYGEHGWREKYNEIRGDDTGAFPTSPKNGEELKL